MLATAPQAARDAERAAMTEEERAEAIRKSKVCVNRQQACQQATTSLRDAGQLSWCVHAGSFGMLNTAV
jgi:hypothetical protein